VKKFVNRFKNQADSVREAIAAFESEHRRAPICEDRAQTRHLYRHHEFLDASIEHAGGATTHVCVKPFDLSDGGMGMFSVGFVFPNSKIQVALITADGEKFSVVGHVRRCDFLSGQLHFVSLAFENPIDAAAILGLDVEETSADQTNDERLAAMRTILGRAKYISATAADDLLSIVHDASALCEGAPMTMPANHHVASDPVAVVDRTGTVVAINPAWHQVKTGTTYVGQSLFRVLAFREDSSASVVGRGAIEPILKDPEKAEPQTLMCEAQLGDRTYRRLRLCAHDPAKGHFVVEMLPN